MKLTLYNVNFSLCLVKLTFAIIYCLLGQPGSQPASQANQPANPTRQSSEIHRIDTQEPVHPRATMLSAG